MRVMVAFLCAVLGLFVSCAAAAHTMPNSVVNLDFGTDAVRAHLILPVNELRYGLGEEIAPTRNGDLNPRLGRHLQGYLSAHFRAADAEARPWTVVVKELRLLVGAGHDDLEAQLRLVPPAGSSPRSFTLLDDAITHEVRSHVILVFARSDFVSGRLGEQPRLIGALQFPVSRLAVNRGPVVSGSFRPAFHLGVKHIADGLDHLLFLFTLLLPAPLLAGDGRWRERRGLIGSLLHLAGIVSAFTLGHSITLVLGAALGWQPAQQPIEILITLSILCAAANAWRPWFGQRDAWIAGGFGLVHGMSFAAVIGGYLLSPAAKAEAIFGFNLGIEAVQLLVVLIAAPLLVTLARTPHYGAVRVTGAFLAGTAALVWAAERVTASGWPGLATLLASAVVFIVLIACSRLVRKWEWWSTTEDRRQSRTS